MGRDWDEDEEEEVVWMVGDLGFGRADEDAWWVTCSILVDFNMAGKFTTEPLGPGADVFNLDSRSKILDLSSFIWSTVRSNTWKPVSFK